MQTSVPTWWFTPLSKWVITLVINGISGVSPLITGVITCYNPLTKWDEPPSTQIVVKYGLLKVSHDIFGLRNSFSIVNVCLCADYTSLWHNYH